MAATVSAAAVALAAVVARPSGLPQLRARGESVRCCSYNSKNGKAAASPVANGASVLAAAAAGAMTAVAAPALALVDERMSTEGTGLSLGLSNNLLGWIILGVFGLIWSLYTVYSSTLDDDDESGGLSL